MIDKEFVVYGKSEFIPSKFEEVKNHDWKNKPRGGLWSSPINSEYGWRHFVMSGEIDRSLDTYFKFKLKPGSKIYIIDSEEDLYNVPYTFGSKSSRQIIIDFEKMRDIGGYDGILLTWDGQLKTRFTSNSHFDLYGWDVESLLILNKDCVVPSNGYPEIEVPVDGWKTSKIEIKTRKTGYYFDGNKYRYCWDYSEHYFINILIEGSKYSSRDLFIEEINSVLQELSDDCEVRVKVSI